MAIPRDKFITESNVVLGNFIATAATLGMPVTILHKVKKDYSIVFKRGSGTDHVKPFWNDLVLYEDTVQGLRQPGSQWASSVSVQTLYHEATHAVIDIDDVDENGLFKEAMFLYKKAKLTNGRTVDDPERVAQEAAGCYVGHRAATAWQIFPKIDLWNAVLDKLETKELKVERARELLSMTTNGTSIPEFYERNMQERVFGYQDVGSSQVSVANYPIPHLLKVYCDSVLENKISDTFAQMWQFEPRCERLKARLAGQGFQEKP
jgi:hypothetical protein